MSNTVLSLVAVAVVILAVAGMITFGLLVLRRADAKVARLTRTVRRHDRGTAISADEIIDLHLALENLNSLREISQQIPA